MRLYLMHRKLYLEYEQALQNVRDLIDERELLFTKTEPKSSVGEKVSGGTRINKTEEYVIQMEQRHIKERLEEAKSILKDRQEIMLIKESELRRSKDLYTQIYLLKWVDGLKADKIVKELDISRSQIYNIIGHITKQIEREF